MGNTSNIVTYVNLKETGMAWALHDTEEVRLGFCLCCGLRLQVWQVKFLACVGT
jgi:hypothetical protein